MYYDETYICKASQSLLLTRGTYSVMFYARPRGADSDGNIYYNPSNQLTVSLNDAALTTSLTLEDADSWRLYQFSADISTDGVYPLLFSFIYNHYEDYYSDTSISVTDITAVLTSTFEPSSAPTGDATYMPSPTPTGKRFAHEWIMS
jgi:hypothetical protein